MKDRLSIRSLRVSVPVLVMAILIFCPSIHAESMDNNRKPYVLSAASNNPDHPDAAGLGEVFRITIVNGSQFIDEAIRRNKEIILYINQTPLKGIQHHTSISDGDKTELHFFISHTKGPIAFWNHLISTRNPGELFTSKGTLSVGLDNENIIPTMVKGNNAFNLVLVRKSWFIGCIVLLAALLIFFVVLAVKSISCGMWAQIPKPGESHTVSQCYRWLYGSSSLWRHGFSYTSSITPSTLSPILS